MTLHLVPSTATALEDLTEELPRCKGCKARFRPHGTTEADFPGTVPSGEKPSVGYATTRPAAKTRRTVSFRFNASDT